jgi:RNA polymerase sigma factor (TIGR02999 family)
MPCLNQAATCVVDESTTMVNTLRTNYPRSAAELLPLLYEDLRALAKMKMAREAPGHDLQPTALVHEAWLRLTGCNDQHFENRAHFFAAAAEAMRRILVEHTRRQQTLKRGGAAEHQDYENTELVVTAPPDELLAVHEALEVLEKQDPEAAELVKLRYFGGMSMEEAACAMGMAKRTAEKLWTYARTWLHAEIRKRR